MPTFFLNFFTSQQTIDSLNIYIMTELLLNYKKL